MPRLVYSNIKKKINPKNALRPGLSGYKPKTAGLARDRPSRSQTGIARHKPGGDRHQKLTEQNTQTGQLGTSQVDQYISRLRIKIKYCAICPHSYLNDIDLKRHK